MAKMSSPVVLRAASLTLSGTLQTIVGTVSTDNANASTGAAALGDAALAVVRMTYARHASSTTGRPIVRVDTSMDAPSTAAGSVSNWHPVMVIDGSSFSSGAVELYAEEQKLNPTASGSTTFATHPVAVSCAHWMRVRIYDVDTSNPGAVTNVAFGGAT